MVIVVVFCGDLVAGAFFYYGAVSFLALPFAVLATVLAATTLVLYGYPRMLPIGAMTLEPVDVF
jgi:hypothetical protein